MSAKSLNAAINLTVQATVGLPDGYAESSSDTGRSVADAGAPWSVNAQLNNSNTTPAPNDIATIELTLGAGITTIDLTAAPIVGAVDGNGAPAATQDLTGKKVTAYLISTERDDQLENTGIVKIAPGAATPYPLFGTGNASDLNKNQTIAGYARSSDLTTIGASFKNIDVSGTATDKVRITLLFE